MLENHQENPMYEPAMNFRSKRVPWTKRLILGSMIIGIMVSANSRLHAAESVEKSETPPTALPLPSLPFTISVVRDELKAVPEYMGNKPPIDMDFPPCPIAIDGEYWVIYRNQVEKGTYRYKGTTIEDGVRQPDGDSGAQGYLLGGMYYDETEKKLYAPVHHERIKLWKQVTMATSTDKGLTWKNEGLIIANYPADSLTNSGPATIKDGMFDSEYEGDFYLHVDKAGGYFYLYCLNYIDFKTGSQKLWQGHMRNIVARCAIKDKMAPGKWTKFYNGKWTEPALGGKATHVNAYYVMYNTYLKKYLSFNLNSSLSWCTDLEKQDWSPSFRIDDIWSRGRTFFGYNVGDDSKKDIHTGGQKLFVWTYYQSRWGGRYRIELGEGSTPGEKEGFHPFGYYLDAGKRTSMCPGMLLPYESVLDSPEPIMARRTRKISCDNRDVVYAKDWKNLIDEKFHFGTARVSDLPGASIEMTFKGQDIYWRPWMGTDCGKADVYLDDKRESTVDCYAAPETGHQFAFVKTGLDATKVHTIRVVVRGDKNALSKGNAIKHMAFEHSAESYCAGEGYSSSQGKHQWYYQEMVGTVFTDMKCEVTRGRKGTISMMPWNGANGSAISYGPLPARGFKDPWQSEPCMVSWPTAAAVRKWVAPRPGKVRIEGTARADIATVGEWIAAVKHNAQEVWTRTAKTPSASASKHDVTVTVQTGDALTFIAQRPSPTPGLRDVREEYAQLKYNQMKINQAQVGGPLKIGSQVFTNGLGTGLGTKASSKIIVNLPSPGKKFTAKVGVHAGQTKAGSVKFLVEVAGKTVFQSDVLRHGVEPVTVDIGLDGATEFVLTVTDGGDGHQHDNANWAAASVVLADGKTLPLDELPLQSPLSVFWNPMVTYVE